MSDNPTDDPTSDRYRSTRRRVLASLGGLGLGGGLAAAVTRTRAQQRQPGGSVPTFAMGVTGTGWHGVAPEPIAGTTNPTLSLEAGRTYRIVWRNRDGMPHGLALTRADGIRLDALRVLAADADAVDVFEDQPGTEDLVWADVAEGATDYLNVSRNPVVDGAVSEASFVNSTRLAGSDDVSVPALAYSPLVTETGGVQAVEFEARTEMASYRDVVRPFNADGDVVVE